jgi:hypothetical protein
VGRTVNNSYLGPSGEPPMARMTRAVGDDSGHWWSFPSLQHLPLGRLGFGVEGYSGGGEPRYLSLWPPLPLIVLRDRGPTSLLTGWASPIRTRVKGPMGRWAYWRRDQSNILPLDLTIYF